MMCPVDNTSLIDVSRPQAILDLLRYNPKYNRRYYKKRCAVEHRAFSTDHPVVSIKGFVVHQNVTQPCSEPVSVPALVGVGDTSVRDVSSMVHIVIDNSRIPVFPKFPIVSEQSLFRYMPRMKL